jgi:hypothetical protein
MRGFLLITFWSHWERSFAADLTVTKNIQPGRFYARGFYSHPQQGLNKLWQWKKRRLKINVARSLIWTGLTQ